MMDVSPSGRTDDRRAPCCEDWPPSASTPTTWPRPATGTPSCSASSRTSSPPAAAARLRRVPGRRLPARTRHHRPPVRPARRRDAARRRGGVLARRRPARRPCERLLVAGRHASTSRSPSTARRGLRHRVGRRPVRQRPRRHVQPALPRGARRPARVRLVRRRWSGDQAAEDRHQHPAELGRVARRRARAARSSAASTWSPPRRAKTTAARSAASSPAERFGQRPLIVALDLLAADLGGPLAGGRAEHDQEALERGWPRPSVMSTSVAAIAVGEVGDVEVLRREDVRRRHGLRR